LRQLHTTYTRTAAVATCRVARKKQTNKHGNTAETDQISMLRLINAPAQDVQMLAFTYKNDLEDDSLISIVTRKKSTQKNMYNNYIKT